MRFCGKSLDFLQFLENKLFKAVDRLCLAGFLWLEAFPGERKAGVGGVPLEIK